MPMRKADAESGGAGEKAKNAGFSAVIEKNEPAAKPNRCQPRII